MSKTFSNKEIVMIGNNCSVVEQVFDYDRKGVNQYYYVIEVSDEEYFCNEDYVFKPIPEDLRGFWISSYSGNFEEESFGKTIVESYNWLRVTKKKVVTYKWVGEED